MKCAAACRRPASSIDRARLRSTCQLPPRLGASPDRRDRGGGPQVTADRAVGRGFGSPPPKGFRFGGIETPCYLHQRIEAAPAGPRALGAVGAERDVGNAGPDPCVILRAKAKRGDGARSIALHEDGCVSNEQLSPCRREIADRLDHVKAGASHPRAARGYGLDSAQSISATATVRSSRCADH
jgi:hypothetical protein